MKKKTLRETQTLRAGCSKAEPKIFTLTFPVSRDGQNVSSWIWSIPLPSNPVWCGSMPAISNYRGNSPTYIHTHRQDRLQYSAPQLR